MLSAYHMTYDAYISEREYSSWENRSLRNKNAPPPSYCVFKDVSVPAPSRTSLEWETSRTLYDFVENPKFPLNP